MPDTRKHYTVIVDLKEVTERANINTRDLHEKEVTEIGKIVLRADTKEDVLARVAKALEAL